MLSAFFKRKKKSESLVSVREKPLFASDKPESEDGEGEARGDFFKDALDFEASREEMFEKSERRAWNVALAFGIVMVLSWAAIVLLMPLKETEPYVVKVDTSTGYTEIITVLKDTRVTFDTAADTYWVSKFVRSRERYNYYTLQDDYNAVGLLAHSDVAEKYRAMYRGQQALHLQKRNQEKTEIELHSITLNGRGTATVRFSKHLYVQQHGAPRLLNSSRWVATVLYQYLDVSRMTAEARLVNPLGFQVRDYNIVPEMVRRGVLKTETEDDNE